MKNWIMITISRAIVSFISSWILLSQIAAGQNFAVQPIVLTGDPAPAANEQRDPQHFNALYSASIDEQGDVGIYGSVVNPDLSFGGWVWSNESLTWNHQQGERTTIGGRTYANGALPIPFEHGVGLVAGFSNDRTGVLVGPESSMNSLLLPNQNMPGVDLRLDSADLRISDSGHVAIRGFDGAGSEALWLLDHTATDVTADHLVAKHGDLAPEISPQATLADLSLYEMNGLGEAVARASYRDGPDGQSGDSLWVFSPDRRRLLAKPGDPVEGTVFREFTFAANNEVGTTAFLARTEDGGGLWLDIPGQDDLTTLVLSGQSAFGQSVDTPLHLPININDRNEVGLLLRFTDNSRTSLIASPDGLFGVATQGQETPGLEGWTYGQVETPVLNNHGLAIFQADVIPPQGTFANHEDVLMVRQPSGDTAPLLRTGTEFEVSPGDSRVLSDFHVEWLFDRGALNDQNQFTAALSFDNGTSGVFIFDLNPNSGGGGGGDPGMSASAGVETIWLPTQGGLWDAVDTWSTGVPNGPGHIAALDLNPVGKATITFPEDKDVTLGTLNYRSAVDGIELHGDRALVLQSEAGSAIVPAINTGPAAGRLEIQSSVVGAQSWTAKVDGNSSLQITGALAGESIRKTGTGSLWLGGDNKTWNGAVDFQEGLLVVTHPNGLGTTTTPTEIEDGLTVRFVVEQSNPDADERTFEPFVMDGGRLVNWRSTEFHGPITLRGDGELQQTKIVGDINGPGDLTLLGITELHGPKTYTGTTYVRPDEQPPHSNRLIVKHPDALGSVEAPTYIESGTSIIAEANLNEHIIVKEGAELLLRGEGSYPGKITLDSGHLDVNSTITEFAAPIEISGSVSLGVRDAVLVGGLIGSGHATIAGGILRGPLGNDLTVTVSDGFTIDAPISSDAAINVTGELILRQPTRLTNLTLFPRFELTTEGEGVLIVDEFPLVAQGSYDLDVQSIQPIHVELFGHRELDQRTSVVFERLGGFEEAIYVDRGGLSVSGPFGLGTTAQPTYVASRNAELNLNDTLEGTPLLEEIHLDNAVGLGDGALSVGSGVELAGDLYLGNIGSTIRGAVSSSISGRVHGGTLTLLGNLTLVGAGHTFTGDAQIQSGELELNRDGSLQTAASIQLQGRQGTLTLQNTEVALNDRVADQIPIKSQGGLLRVIGNGNLENPVDVHERLGTFEAIAGHSVIDVERSAVTLTSLSRDPDATLEYFPRSLESRLFLEEAPAMRNGILPAWFRVQERGLATYDELEGVRVLQNYVGFASADASSNVRANSDLPIELSGMTTINSLTIVNDTAIVVGESLKIVSGGLSAGSASISGGQLTAGAGGDYTLYIHGSNNTIASSITDDGDNAVTVVISGAHTGLSGDNTHTGGTTVTDAGSLYVRSPGAIPSNSSLHLDGGHAYFASPEAGTIQIDTLAMNRGGSLLNENGGALMLSTNVIDVEYESDIKVPLIGENVITKIGLGSVVIEDGSNFRGVIHVNEGELILENASRNATVNINPGGRGSGRNARNVLNGGVFTGDFDRTLEVTQDSVINTDRGIFNGRISGEGNLLVEDSHVVLLASNASYDGTMRLRNTLVEPRNRRAFGLNGVVAESNSVVLLDDTAVSGVVSLEGGSVVEKSNTGESAQLLDTLRVLTHGSVLPYQSRRGSVIRIAELELQAESSLLIESPSVGRDDYILGSVEIDGDVLVHGSEAAQHVQLQIEAPLTIGGAIVGAGPFSKLEVAGELASSILAGAKLSVPAANSQLRLVDHVGMDLNVELRGGRVSGNGTLENNLTLGPMSQAAPGTNGIGTLTVDGNLTFVGHSVLELQLASVIDGAGEASDRLNVTGDLVFEADSELMVESLTSEGVTGPLPGFAADKDFIWTIAEATGIRGVDLVDVDWSKFIQHNPPLALRGFRLETSSDQINLRYGYNGDANSDGLVDATDIDVFCGSTDLLLDLDQSGDVNLDDVSIYLDQTYGTAIGDADLNGVVDFGDFLRALG